MIVRPMLANSASELPTGPEWSYEVKWDGYRALAANEGGEIRLISRNEKDLTTEFPSIVAALKTLNASRYVMDGEIVALDAEGRPSFQALQHRRTKGYTLVYYAFDLLSIEGESLLHQPLSVRRERLKSQLTGSRSRVFLSDLLPGSPAQIEQQIRRLGLEGVVAKRRDSVYEPGQRSDAWVKVKFSPQQEFVVGGYKPSAANLESVLVGYFEKGKLHFAGTVRAGLTPHLRAEIFRAIADHHIKKCPFVNLPNNSGSSRWAEGITEEDMTRLRWVKPHLVVAIAFVEWTDDRLLRHAKFVGVRHDKNPQHVVREP
jgi:bifunctional non-homologous end joining protein LigD